MEIVKTTKDAEAKWRAVRILGNLRYEPAVPLLLEALSDPHHYVRSNAARALGDMGVKSAAKPLTDLLSKEKDGGVIEQTSLALANLGAKDALPALKGVANHQNAQTRAWVLQAIGRLGGQPDVPFLAKYLNDPSQSVQMMAAESIQMISGANFGFPLRPGPNDPGPPIQRARQWWEANKKHLGVTQLTDSVA
jgi:HEAT repeat protein